MKKIVLFIGFIAVVSLGLASLSIFPEKVSLPITFGGPAPNAPDQSTKYSDCIDSLDLARHLKNQSRPNSGQTSSFTEMDVSLKKYRQSMDSVVNNLTALEAHQFLHAAYNKHRNTLQSDSLTEAKTYYLLGAMQICYQLDKSLNLTSDTVEKNAK